MDEKYKEEEDGVQRTKREMMEEKYREKKIEYKRIKRKNLWYKEKAYGQSRTKGKKREIKVASVENQELTQ